MGFLSDIAALFDGVTGFFDFLREFFYTMPLAIQVLCYFAFGGFVFLMLLKMLHDT